MKNPSWTPHASLLLAHSVLHIEKSRSSERGMREGLGGLNANYQTSFLTPLSPIPCLPLQKAPRRPNDRNISTQHMAASLGAAYYVLRAFGHPVATCCDNWMSLAQI